MGNRQWVIGETDPNPDLAGFCEDDGSPIVDYRDLAVWKEGMGLATLLYAETVNFPRAELYGMTSQLRRAAVSVPTNIAEGYGRESTGGYIQFLKIAQGSAKELETLIELSRRLGFIKDESATRLAASAERISKMLHALIRAVEKRKL